MNRLPIDDLLPDVVATVRASGRLVLEAPPGAGKTTRVPAALLDAGVARGRDVVVLQPRRLAARLSARRVAAERGEALGDRVGFAVRFDRAGSDATRLWFVTEGVFARRLLRDPHLLDVGCVVLDEFHERHLAGDVALARLARLRAGPRPDLAVVVMSATLDAEPVARFLCDAPRLRSEGRAFPVEVSHLPHRDARPLEVQVAAAIERLAAGAGGAGLDGDVLVFLPGVAEIRRSIEACEGLARRFGLHLRPLHADLPVEEQERAIAPAGGARKVVFATNVAETSITIEGVTTVLDSGLARVASVSPWSGLSTLRVEPVSRAALAQRAGRAGRTRPGRCLRLFPRADAEARPAFTPPEIDRLDLAEPVLDLVAAGEDPFSFPWFTRPPAAALQAAAALLERLGAVRADPSGSRVLTALGGEMLGLPLHPRLARFVVEGQRRGVADEAVTVAALLSERDLRGPRGGRPAGPGREARRDAEGDGSAGGSDLLARLEAFEATAPRDRTGAASAVDRARRQLRSLLAEGPREPRASRLEDGPLDAALSACALVAFPDRVAKRRRPGAPDLVLCGGGVATLAEESGVRDAEFLVAVEAEERDGRVPLVRTAAPLDPAALVEAFPDRIREDVTVRLADDGDRVDAQRRTLYDGLPLESARVPASGRAETTALLVAEIRRRSLEAVCAPEALRTLLARAAFAATCAPGLGLETFDEATVQAVAEQLCEGAGSLSDVRDADVLAAAWGRLPPAARKAAESLAPSEVVLPGGRRLKVEYAPDRPPYAETYLQEFFGQTDGPRVGGGRVPVTLHLLGPNRRPVQVTSDLAGFWARQYPAVRRELSRRYPRHAWPEDPASALPPPRRGGRAR